VLAQEPELLLLDELTTGLDVSLQASVLELLGRLYQEVGFSAVLVTHDLGIARSLSSQVVIMREGRVNQRVGTDDLFDRRVSLSPYARRLLTLKDASDAMSDAPLAVPRASAKRSSAVRLAAERVHKTFVSQAADRRALIDINTVVAPGACVALVGESGSGKTTLTRVLTGLTRPSRGCVRWDDRILGDLSVADARAVRRRRTVLFQNPYTSLNPAMTAQAAVAESLVRPGGRLSSVATEAQRRLAQVGLAARADQPLGQLSGGERRRVGLLCALSTPGDVVVLDEPTAGLDAEHRASVIDLIRTAQKDHPRTMLLVSHDIGFVLSVSDRVAVLYQGQIVEEAATSDFFRPNVPHHPYTQSLWDASRYVAGADVPSGLVAGHLIAVTADFERSADGHTQKNTGCPFRNRCPVYKADSDRWSLCESVAPVLHGDPTRRRIACHGVSHGELDT
ncbi:MAG: ATP-binding cassette domain-containing protein, partial [Myxococcota bacterium]